MATLADPAPAPRRGSAQAAGALARVALVAALAGAALELLAGPGYRLGWWPLGTGLQTLRWAATAAAVAGGLGLAAAALATRLRARRVALLGLAAAAVGLAAAAPPAWLWWQVQRLPPIHDISTDSVDPPAFVAVLPLRRDAPNGSAYDAAAAGPQRRAYPDVAPLRLPGVAPPEALARAGRAARALGLEVVTEVPQDGRLEATATTLLFGFRDDVVVRVAPDGDGSRVDVRSASRVGRSDFGVNAARVRALLARIAADAPA